jgi:hypothetical protein
MDGGVETSRGATWRLFDLQDADLDEGARAMVAEICRCDPRATLDHELRWVAGGSGGSESTLRVWLCRDGERVLGYVPMRLARHRVSLYLGPLRAFSLRVERLSMIGAPVFAVTVGDDEEALTHALLTTVIGALPRVGVFYAYGARADSGLFALLSRPEAPLSGCRIIRQGEIYERSLIRMPPSFEAYMRGLGRKTRENLRRQERRLRAAAPGEVVLKTYTAPEEVGPFLGAATKVSQLTYQWHLYESGLRDRTRHEERLALAAAEGWMLSFVLFERDTPIAFMMGCRYRDTYYSHEIGYDPNWARFSVGNVLHCLVIEYLITHDKEVLWFDFLFGDNPHKRQLRNQCRTEANFYVFPPTVRGRTIAAIVALDNRVAALNKALADHPLRIKLRRLVRHRAVSAGKRAADAG